VLPAYNERAAVAATVGAYLRELPEAGITDFELILVDDGSSDGTGDAADEAARSDGRVRVVRHERNRGQVAAILTGFRAARGAVLTHNGFDRPFRPADTAGPLGMIRGGADVVVVERISRSAYGPVRWVMSKANVALLRLAFRSPFRDHNFVQFYRRAVLETVPVLSSGVSTVTPELILRAAAAGFVVRACPGEYHRRTTGASTVTARKVARTVSETARLWGLMRPGAAAGVPPVLPSGTVVHTRARRATRVPAAPVGGRT
jgi:glycosyltransferase involved in cell wall biosynthesis